jgi:hypothetical protein
MQRNATRQRKSDARNSPSAGVLSAFIGGPYALCEANPIPRLRNKCNLTQHVNEKCPIGVSSAGHMPFAKRTQFQRPRNKCNLTQHVNEKAMRVTARRPVSYRPSSAGRMPFAKRTQFQRPRNKCNLTQHVNEKTIPVAARRPVSYRRSSAFIGGPYAFCETNPIPEAAQQMQPNATRQRKNDARNQTA